MKKHDLDKALAAYVKASRAYNLDCNKRVGIKIDPKRRKLASESARAFDSYYRLLRKALLNKP